MAKPAASHTRYFLVDLENQEIIGERDSLYQARFELGCHLALNPDLDEMQYAVMEKTYHVGACSRENYHWTAPRLTEEASQSMSWFIDCFKKALAADLITADDFR